MALEKAIEKSCRLYVERFYAHLSASLTKFMSNSKRGMPDRILMACLEESPVVIWVEFKKPGGRLSELQKQRIVELRKMYFPVYVIDNRQDFIAMCLEQLGQPVDAK